MAIAVAPVEAEHPVIHEMLAAHAAGFRQSLCTKHSRIEPAVVAAVFDEALAELASSATIHTYLPLLASKQAHRRLDQLAG